jgi:putative two-component system response regulator
MRKPLSVLVVEDSESDTALVIRRLQQSDYDTTHIRVETAEAMAAALQNGTWDLVISDYAMPHFDAPRALQVLQDTGLDIPFIVVSGRIGEDIAVQLMRCGAHDYVLKDKPARLVSAVQRELREAEMRRLKVELDHYNHSLQDMVRAQVKEISESQIATILALAKLSEYRDKDTGNHILRVQRYCRAMATHLAEERVFGNLIDDIFIDNIFHASVLHDIGKVGISDSILLKPGKLTVEEYEIMKTHSRLGAETLAAVMEAYPGNAFVRMGVELARSHHERWDGSGYPDGLAGEAIPLAARILAIADQYDGLRNQRPYKPAFDAARTYAILTEGDGRSDPRHLDPRVLAAFKVFATEFEAIFEELREPWGE